jgi:hypothetical protein
MRIKYGMPVSTRTVRLISIDLHCSVLCSTFSDSNNKIVLPEFAFVMSVYSYIDLLILLVFLPYCNLLHYWVRVV